LGIYSLFVPIGGALIIGVTARYGSERIRGHGIPEAIGAILMNGSRVEPKVACLKPLSSAISIGSGGPFGAEGPIIMTGGAFGSMIAQLFHLTSAERKTLLVAGAAVPVVERSSRLLLGMLSLEDLLKARTRHLEEERSREQPLRLPHFGATPKSEDADGSGILLS
jgi:chloride channel protein, CIC family